MYPLNVGLLCCSVMNLLAEIYSQGEMIPKMFGALTLKEKQEFDLNELVQINDHAEGIKSEESPYMLSTLAPRLWPFMRHSITSVRLSSIRTLVNLYFMALLAHCYANINCLLGLFSFYCIINFLLKPC